jgi:predicted Ser/Thr protein kinase
MELRNNNDRIKYLNEKHKEIIQNQENTLVIDFDKAIQENKEEKIVVKFLNKNYYLPATMPFKFSTFFLRYCLKKENGKMNVIIPDDKILTFIEYMFGNSFMEALDNSQDDKITINIVLETLVPPIMKKWGYSINASHNQKKRQMMIPG